MAAAASGGFTNATDLADYLARKGMPFRDAHRVAAQAVRTCIDRGIALADLKIEEYRAMSELIGPDLYGELSLGACVQRRESQGGPAEGAVKAQLETIRAFLKG